MNPNQTLTYRCSPLCGIFEVEARNCITEHDRICTTIIKFPKDTAFGREPELHNHTAVGGQEKFYTTLALFISSLLGFGIFFTVIKWKSKWKNDHKKPNLMSIQPDNNEEDQLTVESFYSEPASKSFPKLLAGSPKSQEHLDFSPPDNANPKMVDCGSVYHNGGKFLRDTAVNLNASIALTFQEGIDFWSPANEPCETMHAEAEGMAEQKIEWEHDWTRKDSSASDILRVMWNISNLPDDVDPKMVACGLVDHKGGKLTIGDTGVSLTVPPLAIPEGRTEGIFIAIMNPGKEHPKVTSEEPLLSPVVKCGPNGLNFDRHVILSLPHCAVLGDGSWNLKVQYNESDPGSPAEWMQLIDVNRQDGSEPHLAIVEPTMVHIMVDHFTGFTVTGEPASRERARKAVRIAAYVTPPEASGNCVVRVYCVGDTPAHLEGLHNQEMEKLKGIMVDAPKPFHLRDGGGDVLVKLTNYHLGWTKMGEDQKKIYFQHVWEGIECMPCCTFLFSLAGESVPQFHAAFGVKQDCQDGDEQEVIVSTPIKETQPTARKISAGGAFADALNAVSFGNPTKLSSPENIPLDAYTRGPIASTSQTKDTSSGYCSYDFEPLQFTDSLTQRIRNELIFLLDPPHLTANWKHLAEHLGFGTKHIRWLEYRKTPASPTETLLTVMESRKYPLSKLAQTLRMLGREDAAKIIEDQLLLKETSV